VVSPDTSRVCSFPSFLGDLVLHPFPTRRSSDLPVAKQYLPVGGEPILMRTLSVFYRVDPSIALILVLPESDFLNWKELCVEYKRSEEHTSELQSRENIVCRLSLKKNNAYC